MKKLLVLVAFIALGLVGNAMGGHGSYAYACTDDSQCSSGLVCVDGKCGFDALVKIS